MITAIPHPFNVRDGLLCGLTDAAVASGGHEWEHDWGGTLRSNRYHVRCRKCDKRATFGYSRRRGWEATNGFRRPCREA